MGLPTQMVPPPRHHLVACKAMGQEAHILHLIPATVVGAVLIRIVIVRSDGTAKATVFENAVPRENAAAVVDHMSTVDWGHADWVITEHHAPQSIAWLTGRDGEGLEVENVEEFEDDEEIIVKESTTRH